MYTRKLRSNKTIAGACLAAGICVSAPANANLSLEYCGKGLVYDHEFQILWLENGNLFKALYNGDNTLVSRIIDEIGTVDGRPILATDFDVATGRLNWYAAIAWAEWLKFGGFNDWHLPTAENRDGTGICPHLSYDCTQSEMGHLWYTLGGLTKGATQCVAAPCENEPATNASLLVINDSSTLTGMFSNMQDDIYWSETEAAISGYAYGFNTGRAFPLGSDNFFGGRQGYGAKDTGLTGGMNYAWTVRDSQGCPPLPDPSNIGAFNPASSTFNLRNSQSAGPADISFSFGPPNSGWKPLTGDWNGNGQVTVGLHSRSTGTFFLRNSNTAGPADLTFRFGPAGVNWIPLTGDWNGDYQATVGLFNPSTRTFYLRNDNGPGPAQSTFTFGPTGSILVPISGDWDGDGLTTIGLYRPSTGTFWLKNTLGPGSADSTFNFGPGGVGWLPLSGDWDGDGLTTIGLYSPATASFFLKNSLGGGSADVVFSYGPAGLSWSPLAGSWTPAP